MSRIRSYVFTLNNYSDEEVQLIKEGTYTYIVFGKEVGESGTPHLQGFVHFENAKTMSAAHKLKGWKRTALKTAIKPDAAIDYCKKGKQSHTEWSEHGVSGANYGIDADIFEAGVFEQGKRCDLDEVYDLVKGGMSVDDVAWENPAAYSKAFKCLEKLEDIRLRKQFRNFMTEGVWIFGKTGTGKSKYAYQHFEGGSLYSYPYDGRWWDGYKQQETVLIDEFRGQLPFNEMLRMVDFHPNYCVARRCREPMPFISKKVVVTSCMPPWETWKNLNKFDNIDQLLRRFKVYECIDGELNLVNYASV